MCLAAESVKNEWETKPPGFSEKERAFEKEFEGGVSKCWDEDLWSRGAYIQYQPGQMTEHFTQLAQPEGRIHFAGEHTSKMFASMEGALEPGKRVVDKIHSKRGG